MFPALCITCYRLCFKSNAFRELNVPAVQMKFIIKYTRPKSIKIQKRNYVSLSHCPAARICVVKKQHLQWLLEIFLPCIQTFVN